MPNQHKFLVQCWLYLLYQAMPPVKFRVIELIEPDKFDYSASFTVVDGCLVGC